MSLKGSAALLLLMLLGLTGIVAYNLGTRSNDIESFGVPAASSNSEPKSIRGNTRVEGQQARSTDIPSACLKRYRNIKYGFEFSYSNCVATPWGDALTGVEEIPAATSSYPWLFSLDFCGTTIKGEYGCGLQLTADPDFLVEFYSGQDLVKSPFSFSEHVTQTQLITIDGQPAAILNFNLPEWDLSGRELNIQDGKYLLAFWTVDTDAGHSGASWFDLMVHSFMLLH